MYSPRVTSWRCSYPVQRRGFYSKGKETRLKPENIHERVLYNDDRIVLYNKPNRKAVHGGPKVGKTILQQLEEANIAPIYPVHRLDKDTTGVLLMAKDKEMATYLSSLMKHHKILRSYLALCIGVPERPKGEIGGVIGHYQRNDRWVMGMTKRLTSNTRDTITKYRVVKTYMDALCMLELQPVTGAKHQLKVHCAQLLKTPIFGDGKYAPKVMLHADLAGRALKRGLGYQPLHLHAHRILLPEYKQTNDLIVTAPLPSHFLDSLMRVETYTYHKTRTVPKKDRLVDYVDEGLLQKLTGMTARESYFDVNANIPEEEEQLQEMSYAEEEVYDRSSRTIKPDSSRSSRNIQFEKFMKETLSVNSEK